jgi:hypothetical protein
VGGQGQGQEPGGRGTRKIEKQLGCEAEEFGAIQAERRKKDGERSEGSKNPLVAVPVRLDRNKVPVGFKRCVKKDDGSSYSVQSV